MRYLALIFLFIPSLALGSTYYVSPSGSGSTCSTGARCTLATGLGKLAGGDTLILGDGTYTSAISNPPSGTAGAYTTVKAENDGGAIVSVAATPLNLSSSTNYVRIEGLKFEANVPSGTANVAYVAGWYNKIFRTAFTGTPDTTNTATDNNVSNVILSGSYNLLEDCWEWGGGRYKVLFYGGDSLTSGSYNIVRRSVARHDRSASSLGNAVFANYQGKNNIFQNCIAIDSDQIAYYGYNHGPFFLEKGQKGGSVTIEDSIAINFASTFVTDSSSLSDSDPMYAAGNVLLYNSVGWKGNDGFTGYYYTHTNGRTLTVDRSTIGMIDGASAISQPDNGVGFSGGVSGSDTNAVSTNSLYYGITANTYAIGSALSNVLGANDYNAFYGNGVNYYSGSTVGAHDITTVNPLTASLKYLTRIEAGSPLKGTGAGGADIGANIMYQRGVSGTLYGDTGYDDLTDTQLWPWPNEARIKADMSAYPSNWPSGNAPNPVRGFTAGTSLDGSSQTLTKYIWEYLGNQIPADPYSVPKVYPLVGKLSGTIR